MILLWDSSSFTISLWNSRRPLRRWLNSRGNHVTYRLANCALIDQEYHNIPLNRLLLQLFLVRTNIGITSELHFFFFSRIWKACGYDVDIFSISRVLCQNICVNLSKVIVARGWEFLIHNSSCGITANASWSYLNRRTQQIWYIECVPDKNWHLILVYSNHVQVILENILYERNIS